MSQAMPSENKTDTSMSGNPTMDGKKHNPTLVDAWQVFADYDHNANLASDRFKDLRRWILTLGVIATTVAVVYEVFFREWQTPLIAGGLLGGLSPTPQSIAKVIVILLPITVSMLLTWANKFERGMNWILLRGAAESIKREIFMFRTKVGDYNDQRHQIKPREVRLAEKVKRINERLMKTEVNKDGLATYNGPLPPRFAYAEDDDGFAVLTADKYVIYRLEDQIKYYKRKVEKLGRRSRRLNFQIILFGAFGTLLAALNFEVWVAVTAAIVGAVSSYLEYSQFENTITSFNQTGRDLESLRMWWRAVPALEKEVHATFERLVKNAEDILGAEHASWIQNMQDALEELYEEDKKTLEQMDEIVANFANDPDGAYFFEEDDDYISPEKLDALGFKVDKSNNGVKGPRIAASMTLPAEKTDLDPLIDKAIARELEKQRAEDILDEFLSAPDGGNQPDAVDLDPETLTELFGDLDDDQDDDLADLFGES
jgi:hypothetical protein